MKNVPQDTSTNQLMVDLILLVSLATVTVMRTFVIPQLVSSLVTSHILVQFQLDLLHASRYFLSGFCICKHNTTGSNCELCAKGFYGNAIAGTPDDCMPCPCPKDSGCIQLMDKSIVCTDCPDGYAGKYKTLIFFKRLRGN